MTWRDHTDPEDLAYELGLTDGEDLTEPEAPVGFEDDYERGYEDA